MLVVIVAFDFKADYFAFVLEDKINFIISLPPVKELECISTGMINEMSTN